MDLEISDAAPASTWANRREGKQRRMALVSPWRQGKSLFRTKIINALETLLVPESVQKQADFLSRSLAQVHPKRVHDRQAVISAIARPDHIEIFEQVIANQVNFSFAGPQSIRVAQMLEDGLLKVDLINTYAELSVRMFVDLIPNAVLCCADAADRESNLYTGANTEGTPPMIEAAAFRDGIVIVQVDEIVDTHIVTEEGIT
jgi:malonate decarboxylase alpha subunit